MKKLLIINAGITALLGSGLAQAGYAPFYAGGGLGLIRNNGSDSKFCDLCTGSQFSARHTNRHAYKVYGGVNVTDTVGVEADFSQFGKTYDLDMYRPTTDGRSEHAHAYTKTRGIGLTAKARKHLRNGRTSLYGKGGAFLWENRNHMDYTNLDNVNVAYHSTDRGASPTLGIGVEHEINDRWSVRAGWDHYFNVGKGKRFLHLDDQHNVETLRSVKNDVDMIYVGATFNF